MFTTIVPIGNDVGIMVCIHLPAKYLRMPPPALPSPTNNIVLNIVILCLMVILELLNKCMKNLFGFGAYL